MRDPGTRKFSAVPHHNSDRTSSRFRCQDDPNCQAVPMDWPGRGHPREDQKTREAGYDPAEDREPRLGGPRSGVARPRRVDDAGVPERSGAGNGNRHRLRDRLPPGACRRENGTVWRAYRPHPLAAGGWGHRPHPTDGWVAMLALGPVAGRRTNLGHSEPPPEPPHPEPPHNERARRTRGARR